MKEEAQFIANKSQIRSILKYKLLLSRINFYLKLNKSVYGFLLVCFFFFLVTWRSNS